MKTRNQVTVDLGDLAERNVTLEQVPDGIGDQEEKWDAFIDWFSRFCEQEQIPVEWTSDHPPRRTAS